MSNQNRYPRSARVLFRALALLFLCGLPLSAMGVVRSHDPVYNYLRRMEAKGLFETSLPGVVPYDIVTVRQYLAALERQRELLSDVEREQLDYYRFRKSKTGAVGETDRAYPTALSRIRQKKLFRALGLFANGRDFLIAHEDRWAVYGSPVYALRYKRDDPEAVAASDLTVKSGGIEVQGYLNRFRFFLRAEDAHVGGDLRLADRAEFPYRYGPDQDSFDYDETDAFLSWRSSHLSILLGKIRNRWGHGLSDGLLLGDLAASYTQLRLQFRLAFLQLTSLQAKLHQSPPLVVSEYLTEEGVVREKQAEKYLAAHRLQINAGSRLQVGLSEAVMYGERGLDVDYLNPIMFLRSGEHYTGDRDNAMMSVDLKWRGYLRSLWYGELLVDDMTTTKLGGGWFGNKLGYLGGMRAVDPFHLKNTMISTEYTRVEPYVYSHKFAINTHQHYGTLLGATGGPNSDALRVALSWTPRRWLELEGWIRRLRHGANPESGRNVGGDWRRPWGPTDSKRVNFLDGDLETEREWGIKARIEAIYDLFIITTLESSSMSTEYETGTSSSSRDWRCEIEVSWHPW